MSFDFLWTSQNISFHNYYDSNWKGFRVDVCISLNLKTLFLYHFCSFTLILILPKFDKRFNYIFQVVYDWNTVNLNQTIVHRSIKLSDYQLSSQNFISKESLFWGSKGSWLFGTLPTIFSQFFFFFSSLFHFFNSKKTLQTFIKKKPLPINSFTSFKKYL